MKSGSSVRVPERFRVVVELHVLKQLVPAAQAPLILGIHGPSGSGKTYQCEAILKEAEVALFAISGGELESVNAGRPAELIRETYEKAGTLVAQTGSLAALVINDFDTGGGDWGPLNQNTVNTQTMLGELMHLCDFPELVGRMRTRRVPIFITGNDFSKIYEPLRRPGRMSLFEWTPSDAERACMVGSVFPHLSQLECEELAAEFPDFQVAAFAHLRSQMVDIQLLELVRHMGFSSACASLRKGYEVGLRMFPFGEIVRQGRILQSSLRVTSHLCKPENSR
jgi:hypothetical protein